MTELCPCGSGNDFASCCAPYIQGTSFPPTAEVLMRSRYSAYVKGAVDYILETTHPSERRYYSYREVERWSTESTWLKLEILDVTDSTVTFNAYYSDNNGKQLVHREHSVFIVENGKWFFLEGTAR